MASGDAEPPWSGLSTALGEAARRGAPAVGTQHVLFALLSGPEGDALAALRAGGVEPSSAAQALEFIVGVGSAKTKPVAVASVRMSERVEAVLKDAARQVAAPDHSIQDRDVLRALLTSNDPAVGHLIVTIVSDPHKVLEALDATTSTESD